MSKARTETSYLLLVGATLSLALLGYLGYLVYPRFDLPAGTGASLLLLAVAAGVASFFSPCGFPLLVTVVARDVTASATGPPMGRALRAGFWLSLGASAFVGLLGLLVAVGAGSLFASVTFTSTAGIALRATVGGLFLILGLMQIGVLRSPFGPVEDLIRPLLSRQAVLRREHPALGFAVLGFGYLLAGFG